MIFIYRLLIFFIFPLVLLLSLFSKKIRSFLFRKDSNLFKPLKEKSIWIHASSGEFEHAKHLIRKIKEKYPEKKVVVTYYSTSYLKAIKAFELVDHHTPLPLELPLKVAQGIKKINPEIVLFSSGDVWPELAEQLKRKNIPSLLFAKKESAQNTLAKKILYRLTYKKMSHISFISEDDAKTFKKIFTPSSYSVDGDPRLEELLSKKTQGLPINPDLKQTLILGSLWPEDLEKISKSLKTLLQEKKIKKIIVAPHEPSEKNLDQLQKVFSEFNPKLFSQDPNLLSSVVLVDQFGHLFDLYHEAHVAFVGGSFKKKVHSVLEPLSYGKEVLVGPKSLNSFEVRSYSKAPHSFVHVCEDALTFTKTLEEVLERSKEAEILKVLQKNIGASEKLLKRL